MFTGLFSGSGFLPHIHCYLDRRELIVTMLVTDMLIGVAYFVISLTLWNLVQKIKLQFSFVVLCFGLFIGACGATHFMEIWTLWYPDYWLAASVKCLTALASVGTAIYLFQLRHTLFQFAEAARVAEQRKLELESLTQSLESRILARTAEAERSARELVAVFNVASVGMLQADPRAKRLVRVNPKFCEIVGYSEAEVLKLSTENLTYSEDQALEQGRFQSLLEGTQDALSYEKRYVHKSGRIVWASVGITLLRDERGEPDRTVAVVQDITDSKESQRRLAASEMRYRTLTETLPQLVWTCLPDGRCDYLSSQWIAFTGLSMDEQLGLDWLNLVIHPEDRARTLEHWMGAVQGLHPYDIEYRIKRHDGVYCWFKTRGIPIRNEEGAIIYWFGTCTDIQGLRETRQQLEEAVRARDDFLSIASHELKTPLTALRLQCQLFIKAALKGDEAAYSKAKVDALTDQTEKQVRRLARLVDDMLDITRIRSGRLRLERSEFDLLEFVRDYFERLVAQVVEEVGVKLTFSERGHAARGSWDRLRLEQVLGNLFTNAVRYGRKRPIEVIVQATEEEATIVVKDQGIGIAEKDHDKIFGRFERAVDANEVSGLGLGLFIAREIVEAHGGRIWVESKLGEGASFYLSLPKKERIRAVESPEAENEADS